MLSILLTTVMPTSSLHAQASLPVQNAAGQTCQTFNSNAMPYGYAGVNGVDLGSVFSSITSVSGTISGTRPAGTSTLTLGGAAQWRNAGYLSPPWGPTGGWSSHVTYINGGTTYNAQAVLDVIDVRFGTDDGINPGKAQVPQGVQPLYVVQRNEAGHAPMRLNIQQFAITICGQPKTQQQCQSFNLDESNPWQSSAMITLPGSPKKLVTATGSYTVAAANGKAAETKSIVQPIGNQPRSAKFLVSMGNKEVFLFHVPIGTTLPIIGGPGNADYVSKNGVVNRAPPAEYLIMGMSAGTPAHGNITGNVTLCVQ